MGINRPDVYGDTLQWYFGYTTEANGQTISSVDTPVHLDRATGYATAQNKNMVVGTDQQITTKVAGRFILQTHCTFNGTVNDDYTLYWRINSSNESAGQVKWTQKGGNYWAVSSQTILELEEDDEIDLWIENNSDTTNITLSRFNIAIIKIW